MSKSKYKREVFRGEDHKWYVHLFANNGKIVATMQQGYERRAAAIREFDKIFSVKELQLLHNMIEEYQATGWTVSAFNDCLSILDRVQSLIDRSAK